MSLTPEFFEEPTEGDGEEDYSNTVLFWLLDRAGVTQLTPPDDSEEKMLAEARERIRKKLIREGLIK